MSTVLIVGAGLGGLCLAQAFKKHDIPFKLFEKDGHQDFRAQGYRLRISAEGIQALEYALTSDLWELFTKTSAELNPNVPGARLDAVTGEPLDAAALGGGPPPMARGGRLPFSVDRTTFRDVLLNGLEGKVFFGKQVTRYETTGDDGVKIYLDDGTVEEGGLLVGADGLRSCVRNQLLPEYPFIDTGMRIVYGKTFITPEFEKQFPQSAHHGMSLVIENDETAPKTLLLEPMRFPRAAEVTGIQIPRDYVYWVLVVHRSLIALPDDEVLKFNHEQSAQWSLTLSEKWHPSLRILLERQNIAQTSTLRITSVKPEVPTWEPSSRVTLLGDAIHVMPPTGGMGVNTALRDAGDLARRVAEIGGVAQIDAKVIGDYEHALREFARRTVAGSWQGGRKAFNLKPAEECELIRL